MTEPTSGADTRDIKTLAVRYSAAKAKVASAEAELAAANAKVEAARRERAQALAALEAATDAPLTDESASAEANTSGS